MKANPHINIRDFRPVRLAMTVATLGLSACAAPIVPPAPQQASMPRPVMPPSPVSPAVDWRDAPITPGTWEWTRSGNTSSASFGAGQFGLRCHADNSSITIVRATRQQSMEATAATEPAPVSITTTQGTRILLANSTPGGIEITLAARDPLFDAMAFSRGRFVVEAAGWPPLYIPSWTEISRVVEDCR